MIKVVCNEIQTTLVLTKKKWLWRAHLRLNIVVNTDFIN